MLFLQHGKLSHIFRESKYILPTSLPVYLCLLQTSQEGCDPRTVQGEKDKACAHGVQDGPSPSQARVRGAWGEPPAPRGGKWGGAWTLSSHAPSWRGRSALTASGWYQHSGVPPRRAPWCPGHSRCRARYAARWQTSYTALPTCYQHERFQTCMIRLVWLTSKWFFCEWYLSIHSRCTDLPFCPTFVFNSGTLMEPPMSHYVML